MCGTKLTSNKMFIHNCCLPVHSYIYIYIHISKFTEDLPCFLNKGDVVCFFMYDLISIAESIKPVRFHERAFFNYKFIKDRRFSRFKLLSCLPK